MNIGIDGRILEWKYSGIARYVNLLLSFDCLKNSTIYFPQKTSLTFDESFKKKVLKNPFKRRELYEQLILPFHLAKDRIDLFIQPYNFGIPILFRGKSILIVFDIIPLLFKDYFFFARHKKWAKWNYETNTRLALSKASKIVTDSKSAKEDLLKYFPKIKKNKIIPIYYGYKPISEPNNQFFDKFKDRKGITGDYILANAGLEERKNAHLLISAFSKIISSLPFGLKLVITGYNKHYFDKLWELCRKLNVELDVIFTDSITEEEKNLLVKNAKLIVNPSQYEGFGIPILEAASFSKPIITSNIPAFIEVGEDYPMYFKNNNEESLIEKMRYFFQNEKTENLKAQISSEKLLSRFPLSEMEKSWKNIIFSTYDKPLFNS